MKRLLPLLIFAFAASVSFAQEDELTPEELARRGTNLYNAKNYVAAFPLLMKSAQEGYPFAQYMVGLCFCYGNGIGQNYEEAVKWYRKAAEQGHRASAFRLAECLYKGKGVPQNLTEAARLLLQEAEQENIKACYLIGRCYRYGEGVDKNIDEAVKWFEKAAANGDKSAKESISEIKATGK